MDKYRKFAVALLTAVVEGGALWLDAPPWFVSVVGFAGAALVYLVRNAPAETPPDGVR
jgi:hypothetical protein